MDTLKKRNLFLAATLILVAVIVAVSAVILARGPRDSSVEVLERNADGTLLVNDLNDGQMTIPGYDIAVNDYNPTAFQASNGVMTYTEGTSLVGINVNYKNGEIDWTQVAENGVDFAMIRLGYRGYGTGRIVTDTYFETNLKGALENDIEVGVYFFSQAINEEEAMEEAQYCMDLLQDYDITYPIVFDWEPYDSSLNPRTDGLSDEMLTKCAVAFCQAVEDGGYESMVYSNLTYFYLHYDLTQLVDFPLWLAQYNETPTFYYHFSMWQYSSTGTVPGIEGNVDLNIQLIPKA